MSMIRGEFLVLFTAIGALGAVSGVSKEPSSSLGSAGTADASATHVLNTEGIIRGMLDLMDQQATDENTISSEDFHSNVYKPVRAKLVKMIQAMWSMSKTADAAKSISKKEALDILQEALGYDPRTLMARDSSLDTEASQDSKSTANSTASESSMRNNATVANNTGTVQQQKCTCPPPPQCASGTNGSIIPTETAKKSINSTESSSRNVAKSNQKFRSVHYTGGQKRLVEQRVKVSPNTFEPSYDEPQPAASSIGSRFSSVKPTYDDK